VRLAGQKRSGGVRVGFRSEDWTFLGEEGHTTKNIPRTWSAEHAGVCARSDPVARRVTLSVLGFGTFTHLPARKADCERTGND
jgi:hypothetical protein